MPSAGSAGAPGRALSRSGCLRSLSTRASHTHSPHAGLDCTVEAQRSAWPMHAMEGCSLRVCLDTTLSVLSCSCQKILFSRIRIRRYRWKERSQAAALGGRAGGRRASCSSLLGLQGSSPLQSAWTRSPQLASSTTVVGHIRGGDIQSGAWGPVALSRCFMPPRVSIWLSKIISFISIVLVPKG